MTKVEVIARKQGNSSGITFPKKVIEKEHIHENQEPIITIGSATNMRRIKRLVKFKKTAQEIKDEMRNELCSVLF